MDKIAIEHLPPNVVVLGALFRNVKNAAFLQSQLVARNAAFEYALIDASIIISRAHLLAGVYGAIQTCSRHALKTPNVHSETVLSLSPSLNITEAYRRYGISSDTKNIIAVKVLPSDEPGRVDEIREHLSSNIDGDVLPLSDENIADCTDMGKVRKYYKLNNLPKTRDLGNGTSSGTRGELEVLALGAMALRGL